MGTQMQLSRDAGYALAMASVEAGRMRHEYVGTEHLLLGLLRQETGMVAAVLARLGVAPENLRERVAQVVKPGRSAGESDELRPFTSRCQRVMMEARKEVSEHGREEITSGDLLIGLQREAIGVGGQVLTAAGVTPEAVRSVISDLDRAGT